MDEITINILLLGDSNVGKTSLMIRFTDNKFEEDSSATIGVEFKNKVIQIDNKNIKLHILDTAGQEKFRSVASNFIRRGDGIIFTFDLNNEESFENIKTWLITADGINEDYQRILVGNKCDLPNKIITKEKAEKLSQKKNMKYFETSAKVGKNVDLIFKEIAELVLSSPKGKKIEEEVNKKNANIKINSNKSKKKINCCNKN